MGEAVEVAELFALDFPAYIEGGWLVAALVGTGLVIGVLTGLFGVGGGFLINPVLIVLMGIDETLVVGSSLSFTIGTGASGAARHWRAGNVELRTMLLLAIGALVGVVAGEHFHLQLRARMGHERFGEVFRGLYLVVLLLTAWIVARGPSGEATGRSLLQRLRIGPRVDLPGAGLEGVSLTGLLGVGVVIGVMKGLLGIGGGVLFMPLLLLVVGLGAHQAVGTSLGVVVFSSVLGTLLYGAAGDVNLALVMLLLVGSTVGVQVGAWLCQGLGGRRIQRYFVVVVLVAAALVGVDLACDWLCR